MPPVTHEIDDASLSKDSVFDWGSLPGHKNDGVSTLTSARGATSAGNDRVSRYDPRAMNRITDITDLVDDSDESEGGGRPSLVVPSGDKAGGDGAAGGAGSGRRHRWRREGVGGQPANNSLLCRQAIVLLTLVAIVASASLAIGYAVVGGEPKSSGGGEKAGGTGGPSSPAGPAPHAVDGGDEDVALVAAAPAGGQDLLELAERVVTACGERSLDADMTECQHLCRYSMCCFVSGQYSCEADDTKDCAVYAGCEALVEGIPLGAGDEDEG